MKYLWENFFFFEVKNDGDAFAGLKKKKKTFGHHIEIKKNFSLLPWGWGKYSYSTMELKASHQND